MRQICPAAVVLLPWLAVLSGCADPADEKAKAVAVARSAVEASAEQAAAAAARPVTTGRWDEAHLVERLVRAGLAPQAIPGDQGRTQGTRNFRVPGIVFQLGTSRLTVYLYPDSVARLAVTAGLDTTALGPTPVQGEPPVLRQLIVQNNLAAVLIGGSERQQERVMLALSAGLPVQP